MHHLEYIFGKSLLVPPSGSSDIMAVIQKTFQIPPFIKATSINILKVIANYLSHFLSIVF